MKHSLFRNNIPLSILFSLLDKICPRDENFYMVDKNVFSKMIYYGYEKEFLEGIKPYYHVSKQYFLENQITYNRFVTLIRQICNYHNLFYYNDKRYDHSEYTICYFIKKNASKHSMYSLS